MPSPRIRLGRTLTRILRGTVGDSYAIEAHMDAPLFDNVVGGRLCDTYKEFDDGNGMLINMGVSWDLYTDLQHGVCRSTIP